MAGVSRVGYTFVGKNAVLVLPICVAERGKEKGVDKHRLFSAQEWRMLQFAVLDVFTMISKVDGKSGMDEAEQNAFIDLLENPAFVEDMLLTELLASISTSWKHVIDAYNVQFRFTRPYFEQGFSRIRDLIDRKLGKDEGRAFKMALATNLGGIIANASGTGEPGMGHLSEDELQAITAIATWLGAGTTNGGASSELT